jgi:hypothetical protein
MAGQCLLHDYGALRLHGPDARAFLQGQVSNDLAQLQAGLPLAAGLHNPQGRVLALLRLWPEDERAEGVLATLPRERLAEVAAHLRRYVLRSKVQISDATAEWQVWGEQTATGAVMHRLRPASAPADAAAGPILDLSAWQALEVAAGLPEIYSATAGEFVAQMLNLDCIGAIAWNKGCYTGQEIIARAHYRGQVKRRMRRFACSTETAREPGSHWTTRDGIDVRVVRSAVGTSGCEILAVAPLDTRSVDELPLPYALPALTAAT